MSTPTNSFIDGVAEDSFFILRDCRDLFQQQLTEIVRLAGVTQPAVSRAFAEAVGQAHDELAASAGSGSFDQTNGLTSSRITLMGDDELELEIRIGEISRRLGDAGGNALWRVQLRYMTLLRRPEMDPADNPLGPEAIGKGLWAICHESNLTLEAKLALLERVEEQLLQKLPDVYTALNDVLEGRKITPAQTQIVSSASSRAATSPAAGESAGGGNSLAALQNVLAQQFGGMPTGGGMGNPGGGGDVALNAATLVMLNQLAARLDQLEQLRTGAKAGELAGEAAGAEAEVPHALKSKDVDVPLGKAESVALDSLGLIFEEIFAIWELPDTVKTAIGRLQIPLLKIAILDGSLFSDSGHPARRLVNGMGRAALGLPRNVSRAHPVSTRLWKIASTVAETLQGDVSALQQPLADLDALIAERDQQAQDAALPYMAIFQAREVGEQAALSARRWLQETVARGAPDEVLQFLKRDWLRVMEAAFADGGEGGEAWAACRNTADDLLWSVQPKQGAEDRKRLAGMVPLLLKGINAGLDRVGVPAPERAPFLDVCFTLQTNALRGTPAVPVIPEPENAEEPLGEAVVETLEVDGRVLKLLTQPGAQALAYRPAASAPMGAWLQFELAERDPLCGVVCWIGPRSGASLLFNPEWGYAVVLGQSVLEQQMRNGRARVVSSLAIFDIAAERALQQLSPN